MVRPRRSAEKYGQGHRSDRNGEIEAQADKAKAPKRKRGNPSIVDVDPAKVQEVLARIRLQIDAADFGLIKGMAETLTFVMDLLRKQRTTIARLRRVFRFTSEKTATVVGGTDQGSAGASEETSEATTKPAADAADGSDPAAAAPPRPAEEKPKPKPKAKGHGRIATSEYETAQHIPVAHQSLCAGNVCPGCACGTLYDTKAPAQVLRITGQPVLAAVCWDCQRLRCSACGVTYTAPAPKEAQGSKYDESAVSMLALCRYGLGLPHHRLERLQHHLQTPVPASTQWDVLNENAPIFQPILKEMERVAAQGRVIQDDDSYVRILALMGKRRAALLKQGKLPDPERTGLFTTAALAWTDPGPVVRFYSGRKYAAENVAELLKQRHPALEAPILMSDGLASRNVPKEPPVIEANCNAHGRRGIVEQIVNFPSECLYVLQMLGKVFAVEARCKADKLSPQQRLEVHQRESGPVMEELHPWLQAQMADKRVEPNSGLGRAYNYLLKRWSKLTLFLRQVGAPLDNNSCERALKMAIRHRRNSLFYHSEHGAQVGDLFMSLIYTAQLHGVNPLDYLTAVLRHAKDVKAHPADWLPWTYRATLDRLGVPPPSSRAPPSRPRPPPTPEPAAAAAMPAP